MSPKDFIAWVQGYYGPYAIGQRADVVAYLAECSPSYLDALKSVLVLKFSSRFGKTPDVAVFEECKADALEIHADRVDPTRALLVAPPEDETGEDLVKLDWSKILRQTIARNHGAQA